MRADSDVELKKLRVDGGVTNSDHAMQIQADIGGYIVERPEMRECVVVSPSSSPCWNLTLCLAGPPLSGLLSSPAVQSVSSDGICPSPRLVRRPAFGTPRRLHPPSSLLPVSSSSAEGQRARGGHL